MKLTAAIFALALSAAFAAEKKADLPQKTTEKDDPLSLQNLLDPGKPIPEILPAPEYLPDPPSSPGGGKVTRASARSALISAANDYRRKTDLFRKGKVSRDALRSSAVQVAQAAKRYRASLR
jgi:multidrug resistance efflux pump